MLNRTALLKQNFVADHPLKRTLVGYGQHIKLIENRNQKP
jgi:hypothetical protein